MTDTIFALATAPGRGAVAIVRVSGPATKHALETLAGSTPRPRLASLRSIKAADGAMLDRALLLWFPAPASFTGEDCAELHLHGGPAVVDGVTLALINAGARLAEPGEFTRRAFQNGKLELSQAEAIADLIDAETASQARQAINQLEGGLSRRYDGWRATLIEAFALMEAAIDFPEEDAAGQIARTARQPLKRLLGELEAALVDSARGRNVRDGYRIALIGAPNSGKSSLINNLTANDISIVSESPGTTRDVIETSIDVAGYRVLLSDTAGFRESEDAIEVEGARRAGLVAEKAGLRLWIVDGSASEGAWLAASEFLRPDDICVLNKSDLPLGRDANLARARSVELGLSIVEVSATAGDLSSLTMTLERQITGALSGSEFPAATRLRHQELLRDAASGISRALDRLDQPEFAAEDLRLAARAMERVSGRVDAEDVLDRVFSTFCIGK